MKKGCKLGEERLNALFHTMQEEINAATQHVPEEIRYARERQVARARKRARINVPGLKDAAIRDFCELNASLAKAQLELPPDIVVNAQFFIQRSLENYTTSQVGTVQEELDYDLLFDLWRYGPGTSNGVQGTHTAQKIDQPMTATFLAKPLVSLLRARDPYFSKQDLESGVPGIVQVRGSRLATVLKNEVSVRTIAIEPSGNMALQLAGGSYLEGALRYIGLDIRNQQEKNKFLAWLGSVTGSFATIDLSKASDMILIRLVRLLWPKRWFSFFMAVRSHEIEVRKGEWVVMNMMSTMGNGFTFPMMTLTIVALLYAYRAQFKSEPTLWVDWKCTAVFGDDIILRSDEYEEFTVVLQQAGLVVNKDKSYATGAFRESCGGDYYKGTNVTPVYVKSLLADSDIFVAINQLLEWGARNRTFLHNSLLLLKSYLRGKAHFVPEWFGDDSGIRTAACPQRFTYLRPAVVRFRYTGAFPMKLAVGGYVEADGDDLWYVPRPFKTRYRVAAARLPRGFLTGVDPLTRSPQISASIEAIAPILFS